jgi:hypothetical protein
MASAPSTFDNQALRQEFNREIQAHLERERSLGIHSTRFLAMLHDHNGDAVEVVKRLLRSPVSDERLGQMEERPDLYVEQYVVMEKYRALFEDPDDPYGYREVAQWHLTRARR